MNASYVWYLHCKLNQFEYSNPPELSVSIVFTCFSVRGQSVKSAKAVIMIMGAFSQVLNMTLRLLAKGAQHKQYERSYALNSRWHHSAFLALSAKVTALHDTSVHLQHCKHVPTSGTFWKTVQRFDPTAAPEHPCLFDLREFCVLSRVCELCIGVVCCIFG